MNIKLRDANTGLVRAKTGTWTADPEQALLFASIAEAAEAAREFADADLEVVVRDGSPSGEMAFRPAFCAKPKRRP